MCDYFVRFIILESVSPTHEIVNYLKTNHWNKNLEYLAFLLLIMVPTSLMAKKKKKTLEINQPMLNRTSILSISFHSLSNEKKEPVNCFWKGNLSFLK